MGSNIDDALTSLFGGKTFLTEFDKTAYDKNYTSNNMDLLLNKAKRIKSVRECKIFEFMDIENDPNFSRRWTPNSKKLDKYLGKLSIASTLVSSIMGKLQMVGVAQYIPKNFLEAIYTFQTLANAQNRLLPTIKQLIPFNYLENAIFNDLAGNVKVGNITLNDMILMADRVWENVPFYKQIMNGNLKSILSLPLQKILPKDLQWIWEDVQYLDNLLEVFGDGLSPEFKLFKELFSDELDGVQGENPSAYIQDYDSYDNVAIGINDPLGFENADTIYTQIVSRVQPLTMSALHVALNGVKAEYPEYIAILTEDVVASLEVATTKSVGAILEEGLYYSNVLLPPLNDTLEGVKVDSHNNAVQAIRAAVTKTINNILTENTVGSIPVDTRPSDHLYNLKKNLEAHKKMMVLGQYTNDEYGNVTNFLRTNLLGDLTDKQLTDKVNSLLKIFEGLNG